MGWEVILPRNKVKGEITERYFYQTLSQIQRKGYLMPTKKGKRERKQKENEMEREQERKKEIEKDGCADGMSCDIVKAMSIE